MTVADQNSSFETLFGELDFKKGDAARAVTSPAAYLADLVQLLHDYFDFTGEEGESDNNDSFDLKNRRSDIKDLILDGDNTFDLLPYLDIVNDLLRRKIESQHSGRDAFSLLKELPYPTNLPLNFDFAQFKLYLSYLKIKAHEIEDSFAARGEENGTRRAAIFLGLSPEETGYVLADRSENETAVKAAYGLTENDAIDELTEVDRFLYATGLSGPALRELLMQNLAQTARDQNGAPETTRAAEFFTNRDLGGYAVLDDDESMIVWRPAQLEDESDEDDGVPLAWFDRADRLIRLAQKSGFTLSEVDLVLRTGSAGRLNNDAIKALAVLRDLHERIDRPIDELCALLGDISTLGQGDEDRPLDLFNRLFNGRPAELAQTVIPGSAFTHQAFAGTDFASLSATHDLMGDKNSAVRRRLQKSLRLTEKDLAAIVEKFRQNVTDVSLVQQNPLDLTVLSLLYRVATLTDTLDLAVGELFELLDVIKMDAQIRRSQPFRPLIPQPGQLRNGYQILYQPHDHPADALWLMQLLTALAPWMQRHDLTPAALKLIQQGVEGDLAQAQGDQVMALFKAVADGFAAVVLRPQSFVSERFNDRSARVIFDAVTAHDPAVVSSFDQRIVTYDGDSAAAAARGALNRLAAVSAQDFGGLPLAGRTATKLMEHLVIHGLLTAGGEINAARLDEMDEKETVFADFSALREPLFDLIHEYYLEEVAAQSGVEGADLDLALFLSDLSELEITQKEAEELNSNLLFNGILDDKGQLLDPAFFADEYNAEDLQVNTFLTDAHSRQLLDLLRGRQRAYEASPYALKKSIFEPLGLSDLDLEELVENLTFNDYIDGDGRYLDKESLRTMPLKSFKIALPYYPLRKEILAILQDDIDSDRQEYFAMQAETLAGLADEMVGALCVARLQDEYLADGYIRAEMKPFLAAADNADQFDLGTPFSKEGGGAVFNRLQSILAEADRYRLNEQDLTALELSSDEVGDLIISMIEDGYLDPAGQVLPPQLDYFLNIDNALDFHIAGFDDFNKDIFFACQAVAREVYLAQMEISGALGRVANQQEEGSLAILAEGLEVDPAILIIICRAFLYHPDHLAESLLQPILAAVAQENTRPALGRFYSRLLQFIALLNALKLTAADVEIAFHDQNLVEKFSETVELPADMAHFDALLPLDDKVILFKDNRIWVYDGATHALEAAGQPLATLSNHFSDVARVDAAFVDPQGQAWLLSGGRYFMRPAGETAWEPVEKKWGEIENHLADGEPVQAAFTDREGVTYLFSGDQYLRYSAADREAVDPGFPRKIRGNLPLELWARSLPEPFNQSIDAAFETDDGQTFLFKDDQFIRFDPENSAQPLPIAATWGQVDNRFADLTELDGALSLDGQLYLFLDGQVMRYSDALENEGVTMDEGYPQRLSSWLADLPDEFDYGVDAALAGDDGHIHLFKNNQTVRYTRDGLAKVGDAEEITGRWGRVRNRFQTEGTVDAAFTGLDGCTYLFSGDQFVRYSGQDYSRVDEGYPKGIGPAWGGLDEVSAAFVMDGKTYLFAKDMGTFVRYSSNEYDTPDEGYPLPLIQEQFWNLPQALTDSEFLEPDAILVAKNEDVYLFKEGRFVRFDHAQRWWDEPQPIGETWNELPFGHVDAAFTGKDGRAYLFADGQYVRYSDPNFQAVDDRYPRAIGSLWGQVTNQIERNRRIDAAVVVEAQQIDEAGDGQVATAASRHTYLFSGSQYFRYTGDQYDFVDEGYPRSIQGSLHTEPGFKGLAKPLRGRIDAAFADQRSVYLVQGDQLLIVADEPHRRYPAGLESQVEAALIDEGSLYLATEEGWRRRNHLEAAVEQSRVALPPLLRDAPSTYRSGLSAVLQGTDGNEYLFKEDRCFNMQIGQAYPIREEWGRVRNNIALDNRVDAAFVGRDGRTYLFNGDQFVSYAPGQAVGITQQSRFIDGLPRPIADHWGGLEQVKLAFVRDGITYLMEPPDENGEFRLLRYSGDDYSRPDDDYPQIADFSWWEIPEIYREEGFERVDAVLNDDDNIFLFQGREFIQFNVEDALWTYAKPIERVWRGLDFDHAEFEGVATAFQGTDGRVIFFADGHFSEVTHNIDRPAAAGSVAVLEIRDHWGRVDNSLDTRSTIDAAFVWQDEVTYLFSGPHYVRYSSDDYRFVDEGYPKSIAEWLKDEPPFAAMPDTLAEMLAQRAAEGQGVDAAVASKGTVYLFIGPLLYVVSPTKQRGCSLGNLGHVQNRIVERQKIDAAFLDQEDRVLLLAGDQIFRYSDSSYEFVDEGFPREIGRWLSEVADLGQVPESFDYNLDAAVRAPGEGLRLYLFKGTDYLDIDIGEPRLITARWGRVDNRFIPEDEGTNVALDAAFVAPDGRFYLFKHNQFMRYSVFDQPLADEGFPRPIRGSWGHLPDNFEDGIDGGFVFEGKIYLLHDGDRGAGAEYVRYSRADTHVVDGIYPQKIAARWRRWGDFLLSDIRLLASFKALQRQTGDEEQLTALFNPAAADAETPYETLHDLFGWPVSEAKWVKRHHAFLSAEDLEERRFNLELLDKMALIFDVSERIGAGPSVVHAELWQQWGDSAALAGSAWRFLGGKYSERDWGTIKQEIHDALNLWKRDAWMPLAIFGDPTLKTPTDLYEQLLIDVEMGSAAQTSRVKEAISAIQLYFHRYLVNLEEITLAPQSDHLSRDTLKERWRWLKNYRVWEANRKVFLYPENYIRPELRDTKTPEFQKLEEMLLQGELNAETAEAAFNGYLESFGQVSALKIVGANVYAEGDEKVLMLVGHTRLDPRQFYYRLARFAPNPQEGEADMVVWDSWEQIDATIKSDRVFPIRSHGRLMVFWIEIEDIEAPEAKFKSKAGDDETISEINTTQAKLRHEATIKYSVLKYNKHWTPPQQLKRGIRLNYEIDAAYAEGEDIVTFAGRYVLKSSETNPHASVRRIEEVSEFENLPASFQSGIEAATIFNNKRYLFKGNDCIIQETGSSGRILARRTLADLIESPLSAPIYVVFPGVFHVGHVARTEERDNPVITNGVDAAFSFDGQSGLHLLVLVDTEGTYSFYEETADHRLRPIQDVSAWGFNNEWWFIYIATLVNRSGNFRPADSVFSKDSLFYVLRDGQYEVYDDVGQELVALDGFPKPIRGNLSFNMDKFYNKLHLEESDEEIFVSYSSPQNKIMVYGRLKPDYTFEDIPINTVPAVRMLRSWPSFWSSNLASYHGNNSDSLYRGQIGSFAQSLNQIQEEIREVQTVRSATNSFSRALESAGELQALARQAVEAEADEDERPDLGPLQENIRTLGTQITELLAPVADSRNVSKSVDDLNKAVASLIKTTDRAGRGSDQKQQVIIDGIGRDISEGTEEIATIRAAMNERVKEIKNRVKSDTDTITKFTGHRGQSDVSHHGSNARHFDYFLNQIDQYATVWRDRLDSDAAGETTESAAARTQLLDPYRERNQEISTLLDGVLAESKTMRDSGAIADIASAAGRLNTALEELGERVGQRTVLLNQINSDRRDDNSRQSPLGRRELLAMMQLLARAAEEKILGAFDLFPDEFGINETGNFAFSEPDHADWYCFEAAGGTFLARPNDKQGSVYEIIRLTTSLVPTLSGILFAQGIRGFLSLTTQETDEIPAFGTGTGEVRFTQGNFTRRPGKIKTRLIPPITLNLDFRGASGIYYDELFFHAPFLIAQALNDAQKFEEAKTWYEFIFDPTSTESVWQYLPFTEPTVEGNFLVDQNQIRRYLDDPFDPHAIAALRPTAYRKAIVMRYIDNLIDWGDMLFRQFSIESINEARMLYTLGRDLLGDRPESLGTLVLMDEKPVIALANTDEYDFVIQPARQIGNGLIGSEPITIIEGTPHDSVGTRYFFVPENELFFDYWGRVEDRLFKIRNSQNIDGQFQMPPLFQPPIDPMALVLAVARGISLSQLVGGAAVQVPHYRFEFLMFRAQGLIGKLNQYSGELLATLEKKDAEALSVLQTRQEGRILDMMIAIREAQIKETDTVILNLEESQAHAQERITLYQGWLDDGMLPEEQAQIALMIAASVAHFTGSLLKMGAMIASLIPDAKVGPFIMGIETGGSNIGDSLGSGAEIAEGLGEGLSITGEVLGTQAQIKHMIEDWETQLMIATSEDKQIAHQLEGARLQKMIAEYELAVLQKEIEHNQSIETFMKDKFTNESLYRWMAGRLSGLYYQTYQMAFDMARMAEKAFQFERGIPERNVSFITGGYWDSQRQGLLAGEALVLDLDRMEQSFIETNEQRLEISKEVSLLELDPMAFLRLKQNGTCEFRLDEAFYDMDFPGHYGRQFKTMAVKFDVPEGVTVNATLTQLSHQTVLEADTKAVKHLLEPRDMPPTSIRGSWRSNQQIILSHHDQYEKNNGLFELRFDSERYLPFEGTGAVSHWRLDLNGKSGSIDLRELVDLTLQIQYTARNGGGVFADEVKGLLKPYQTVRFFDMTYDFAEPWNDFLNGDDDELVLPFTRELFPNMSSSKIDGIFSRFDLAEPGRVRLILNGVDDWTLENNSYQETNGLTISRSGSELRLAVRGNKDNLRNVQMVFSYRASVR